MFSKEIDDFFDPKKDPKYKAFKDSLYHYNYMMVEEDRVVDLRNAIKLYKYLENPKKLLEDIISGDNQLFKYMSLLYVYNTRVDPKWIKTRENIKTLFGKAENDPKYDIKIDGKEIIGNYPYLIGNSDICDFKLKGKLTGFVHCIFIYSPSNELFYLFDMGCLYGSSIISSDETLSANITDPKLLKSYIKNLTIKIGNMNNCENINISVKNCL
jgi:hypothetical protein